MCNNKNVFSFIHVYEHVKLSKKYYERNLFQLEIYIHINHFHDYLYKVNKFNLIYLFNLTSGQTNERWKYNAK